MFVRTFLCSIPFQGLTNTAVGMHTPRVSQVPPRRWYELQGNTATTHEAPPFRVQMSDTDTIGMGPASSVLSASSTDYSLARIH